MGAPKTYPPIEAEREKFYIGLTNHTREKNHVGTIYEKQMGQRGSAAELCDNRCQDSDRLQRKARGENVYLRPETCG